MDYEKFSNDAVLYHDATSLERCMAHYTNGLSLTKDYSYIVFNFKTKINILEKQVNIRPEDVLIIPNGINISIS